MPVVRDDVVAAVRRAHDALDKGNSLLAIYKLGLAWWLLGHRTAGHFVYSDGSVRRLERSVKGVEYRVIRAMEGKK